MSRWTCDGEALRKREHEEMDLTKEELLENQIEPEFSPEVEDHPDPQELLLAIKMMERRYSERTLAEVRFLESQSLALLSAVPAEIRHLLAPQVAELQRAVQDVVSKVASHSLPGTLSGVGTITDSADRARSAFTSVLELTKHHQK